MATPSTVEATSDAQLQSEVGKEEEFLSEEATRLQTAFEHLAGKQGASKYLKRAQTDMYDQNDKIKEGMVIIIEHMHADFSQAIDKINSALTELELSFSYETHIVPIAIKAKNIKGLGSLAPAEREAFNHSRDHMIKIRRSIENLNETKADLQEGLKINNLDQFVNLRGVAGKSRNGVTGEAVKIEKYHGHVLAILGILKSASLATPRKSWWQVWK